MKVLIAGECSGLIRDAFAAKGHDAWSCDLEPTERPGQHYQGDIFNIINNWDIIGGKPRILIGHPVCRYLCNSGVSWLYHKDHADRWQKMLEAAWFFKQLWSLDIEKICLENPIPHKYANLPKYTQIIQPWQFGEDASKATCLWLKGLPKLTPTNIILKDRYSNQTKSGQNKLPPSEHRARDRSRTYIGIANAMSNQWNF
jgi:hypothetical protein